VNKKSNPHILVPVDFSIQSEAALIHAKQYAQCLKTKLLVLHVIHDPAEVSGYYQNFMKKKQLVRMEDSAAHMLDDFLAKMAKKHKILKNIDDVESLLVKGLPLNRILEVSKKFNASMIVMGSKGHTGLKHLLLGSVAEGIVQLSSIPVTVVKTIPKDDHNGDNNVA